MLLSLELVVNDHLVFQVTKKRLENHETFCKILTLVIGNPC